jgi:hypothetical protein
VQVLLRLGVNPMFLTVALQVVTVVGVVTSSFEQQGERTP